MSRLSLSTIGFGVFAGAMIAPHDEIDVARHAGLLHRRHVGQERRALLAADREQAQLARLHVRHHRRDRIEHHLRLAAEQVRMRGAAALVRNVLHLVPVICSKASAHSSGLLPRPDVATLTLPGLALR